jgi:hypothetical protein
MGSRLLVKPTVPFGMKILISCQIDSWHSSVYFPRQRTGTDPGPYKFAIRTKRKRTENANEANEKRTNASHERYEKRTIHETNARYTRRKHDTRNECTIRETNARYTKPTHDIRTNESLERTCSYILSNDKRSWLYRGTL